jgi:hypothetical protein
LQARQVYRRRTTQSDPLAVDGQITIGNVTLAEPYELTLHAAFLAGDGIGTSTWKCISSSVDLQPSTWYCGR